MGKKIFPIFLVFALFQSVSAQLIFQKSIGKSFAAEWGIDIKVCSDSGYIIAGHGADGDNPDYGPEMHVVRTNKFGDTLWTRDYGGQYNILNPSKNHEEAFSVEFAGDSGFILVGHTESFDTMTSLMILCSP